MVSIENLEASLRRLSNWPNRNSNGPHISEVAQWLREEFAQTEGTTVTEIPVPLPVGPRVPVEIDAPQILAVRTGTHPELSENLVVMSAHFDSLSMVDKLNGAAPGANDDGSGIAALLEAHRILATESWPRTVVFAAFSAEEQGLLGAKGIANRAREENWQIDAVLNNDMIGNSVDDLGRREAAAVRIFSEESPSHRSRELARWANWMLSMEMPDYELRLVLRPDRMGRGGDHTPFNQEGFTAVRFTECNEAYSRQHTEADTVEAMDLGYLAKNVEVNVRILRHLLAAEPAPTVVHIDRAQGYGTGLSWSGNAYRRYRVYWRRTTSAFWEGTEEVTGCEWTISHLSKDEWEFAVGAVDGIPVPAT